MFAQFFRFLKSSIDYSLNITFQSFVKSFEHCTTTGQDDILERIETVIQEISMPPATYTVEFTSYVDRAILNDIVNQFR